MRDFLGRIGDAIGRRTYRLPNVIDWLVRAIKAVGNYGELYQRNIGPLGIPRGVNEQWSKGGSMYAPPIR